MKITALPALQQLQSETIMWAIIIGLIALLIAYVAAILVNYQGGKDRSYVTRRWIYSLIGIFTCIGYFGYNDIFVKSNINNMGWQSEFSETNFACIGIIAAIYLIGGVTLMFIRKKNKFGTILPQRLRND